MITYIGGQWCPRYCLALQKYEQDLEVEVSSLKNLVNLNAEKNDDETKYHWMRGNGYEGCHPL